MSGRARVRVALTAVLLATTALLAAACGDGQVRDDGVPESEPSRPAPSLRLMVVTDLQGTLEPCGCQSRPLGGIDKMAAKVDAIRDRDAPAVLVAAGGLFFGPGEGHGGPGQAKQGLWKAHAAVDILGRMELVAATPGQRDLSRGADTLRALTQKADFPMLSAGLQLVPASAGAEAAGDAEGGEGPGDPATDGGTGAGEPKRLLRDGIVRKAGKRTIGIFGVSQLQGHGAPEGTARDAPPLESATEAARDLREQEVDLLVALVAGTRRTARRVASRIEGVDFVVQGGLGKAEPILPAQVNGALVVHAGRQGQGLLVVDVWHRDDGGWRDIGSWARSAERKRLEQRAAELEERIAAWEDDDSVAEQDVARQRKRLREMRKKIEALGERAALPDGNAVAARYEELPPEAPADEAITKRMTRYYKRVNEHNRKAFADRKPPPVEKGKAGYVGSEACATCHKAEHEWWKDSKHGRAYSTLEERHKEFNLECVGCHVTGYEEPGGATVTHVEDLRNVGCESCHGPGEQHVSDPSPPHEFIQRDTPEEDCVTCHNEKHSDLFVYDSYKRVLMVPGHGRPKKEQ